MKKLTTIKSTGTGTKPSTPKKKKQEKLYIVAIGASAGGLEAINTFFDNVPDDSGLSFVLIQHLSPDYKSMMPELLARHTKLKIQKAAHNVVVRPNYIYTIPADKNMTVFEGKLLLEERESPKTLNLPINLFLKSLAEDQKQRAIGVILSGTGSDGTLGMESIKEQGGMVIAQDPNSAAFDSMPRSTIATGLVDFILEPQEMPETIINYVKHPYTKQQAVDTSGSEPGNDIENIISLLYKKTNLDFHNYKKSTIIRRIERRMGLRNILSHELYFEYLNENTEEIELLSGDLLIGVTGFFRDNKAFELLESEVIAPMVKNTDKGKEIRVWVVGCSTGQEAYSIAILYKECMRRFKKRIPLKIFATDINEKAVERAGKGVYTEAVFDEVPNTLVKRYFKKIENNKYQVNKELREVIIFAKHDAAKDPPFNNIDLACCRNLLIYIEPPLQERIMSYIHFSLNQDGALFLGASEALGSYASVFNEIDKKYKLFRNRSIARMSDVHKLFSFDHRPSQSKKPSKTDEQMTVYSEAKMINNFKDALLNDLVPPTLIINENNDVVHVAGETEKYISLPKKQLTLNVLKMIDEQLYVPLSNIVSKVKAERKKVISPVVSFENGDRSFMQIVAKPYTEPVSRNNFCIISFIPAFPPESGPDGTDKLDIDKEKDTHIRRLEEDLKETKEYLQATIEELETSNEELQATNEELVAANEELQSSNEELQSVNEELYTVNNEFQDKLGEMSDLNDDLSNFIQSTKIATLFLDMELNIRRYTDAIIPLIKITEHDIGRYIGDFAHAFAEFDLVGTARKVLDDLQPVELELITSDNEAFLLKARPYQTAKKDIRGVVLTAMDVNKLKLAEQLLKKKTEELERLNGNLEQFAYVSSHDLQEPLRTVISFVEMLSERLDGNLDDKAATYLSIINQSSQRMKELIEGLLEFSRIGKGKALESIDCREMIMEILQDMDTLIKESGATVELGKMPVIVAYKQEMRQLFQNLVSNAIKFRKPGVKPKIQIKARKLSDKWKFSINDNGIGIEAAYKDRIFVIFQRLHTRTEYKGTGIGLAHCKKIVELHNGEIWFNSQLGKGTTFYFTIMNQEKPTNLD